VCNTAENRCILNMEIINLHLLDFIFGFVIFFFWIYMKYSKRMRGSYQLFSLQMYEMCVLFVQNMNFATARIFYVVSWKPARNTCFTLFIRVHACTLVFVCVCVCVCVCIAL
jgi:hypothetical protein